MEFGLFMELSVPRPWSADSERQSYENALEQVRLADELGFDYVWAVEHHFLEEYSHSSAPDLFLTACAMQTKRIRVGHGVVACVPQYQSPIRIAERAAVLDILSGGRVELGTGRSATWTELGGFRAEPRRDQEDVGRVRARHPEDVDAGTLQLGGPVVLDARARSAAEAGAEAAPSDVGRGDLARHRARRRRSRPRVSRPRTRRLRRVGEEGEVVPAPRPALRPGRLVRERQGVDDQLPVVRRRRRPRAARRACASRASSATWPRSSCRPKRCCPRARTRRKDLLPALRREAGGPGRRRAGIQGRDDGHPRRRRRRDPQVGGGGLRRHQLLRQLHGSAAATVRARQHAHVRRARDAPVQGRTRGRSESRWGPTDAPRRFARLARRCSRTRPRSRSRIARCASKASTSCKCSTRSRQPTSKRSSRPR